MCVFTKSCTNHDLLNTHPAFYAICMHYLLFVRVRELSFRLMQLSRPCFSSHSARPCPCPHAHAWPFQSGAAHARTASTPACAAQPVLWAREEEGVGRARAGQSGRGYGPGWASAGRARAGQSDRRGLGDDSRPLRSIPRPGLGSVIPQVRDRSLGPGPVPQPIPAAVWSGREAPWGLLRACWARR